MFWLTPLETKNKNKSLLEEEVYGLMFDKVLGNIAHTYAVYRDGTPFNVKTDDSRRCVNQNICNLGVMRFRPLVKAKDHVIDD